VAFLIVRWDGLIGRVNNQALYNNLAIAEKSTTYDKSCENSGVANEKLCFINKSLAGKKILILGDSHAGHLYPWFVKNSKVNTTFYVKSGCPMIVGFERVGKQKNCSGYTKHALELAESGVYETVIISQNWTDFSSNADDICFYENGQCKPLNKSSNPRLAVERTRESLIKILDKKINVVVLDGTPIFQMSAPRKISRDLFWTGKMPSSINSDSFFDKNREYDEVFRQLKNHPNFNDISLRSKLCKKDGCFIYDEKINGPIYMDNSHFNPEWLIKNGDVFSMFVQ
jgi:hypothetical protein